MLSLRLIYGLSLAGLVLGLLLADGYLAALSPPHWPLPGLGIDAGLWLCRGAVSTAVFAVLIWLAAGELVQFARAQGYRPNCLVAQLVAVALLLAPYVAYNSPAAAGGQAESWGVLLLALGVGLACLVQAVQHRAAGAMVNLATTIFISVYTGGLASFLVRLRMEIGGTAGLALLLFSLFVIKMTDTGAYSVGSLAGRHALIPWLSPRKTWEGLVGGLLVAILCAVGVGHWLHQSGWFPQPAGPLASAWGLAVFGLVSGLLAVAGDLCASLLKRDAAAKDSGDALPGLGGFLDVVDSPLLAGPAAWFFWTRLVHLGAGGR